MDAWAQLVSTTNICIDPVKITKQKFVIGRAHDADLCLSENRLVSGHHCIIEKDSVGDVWLRDISTNGTVLNSTNRVSGKQVRLKHGDEVFIVFRSADSDLNVAFLFQDLEELHREELETTDEASGESDETQPYEENENSLIKAEDDKLEDICASKRRLESADGGCDEEPAAKVVKLTKKKKSETICREGSIASITNEPKKAQVKDGEEIDELPIMSSSAAQVKDNKEMEELPIASSSTAQVTSSFTAEHTAPNQLIVKGSQQSFNQGEMASADKLLQENAITQQVDSKVQLLKETSSVEEAAAAAATSSGVSSAANKTSDVPELLEEQLNCAICQEILYNSICLQPCMHIFCAGCYSGWMDRSTDCPTCRRIVTRIKKYHPMKNVIEAYLTACPEKQRPEEDRKRLDAIDRITKDNMKPHSPNHPVDEDYDDEDVSDGDVSEEEVAGMTFPPPPPPAPVAFWPNYRPQKTICRQCPGYQGPRPAAGSAVPLAVPLAATVTSCNEASSSKAGPSGITTGPSAKTYPVHPAFMCSVNQNHIICLCCLQPMPHRWNEVNNAHLGVLPPQQCAICSRAFCHQYWGCYGQCDGCLAKFSDMKFRSEVLNNLILQNTHESKGFRLYLESKHLAVEDVHRTCVEKLRARIYSCADDAFLLGSDFPICYNCALRNFSQLAFDFRRDIPEIDMPVEFRGRPNCRWGRHCRTQTHNQRHAETYNHIL